MGAGGAEGSLKIAVLEQLFECCEKGIEGLSLMLLPVVKFEDRILLLEYVTPEGIDYVPRVGVGVNGDDPLVN